MDEVSVKIILVKKRATRSLSIFYLEKREDAHLISILYISVIAEYTVKKRGFAKIGKDLVILLLLNCMSELVYLN